MEAHGRRNEIRRRRGRDVRVYLTTILGAASDPGPLSRQPASVRPANAPRQLQGEVVVGLDDSILRYLLPVLTLMPVALVSVNA